VGPHRGSTFGTPEIVLRYSGTPVTFEKKGSTGPDGTPLGCNRG